MAVFYISRIDHPATIEMYYQIYPHRIRLRLETMTAAYDLAFNEFLARKSTVRKHLNSTAFKNTF